MEDYLNHDKNDVLVKVEVDEAGYLKVGVEAVCKYQLLYLEEVRDYEVALGLHRFLLYLTILVRLADARHLRANANPAVSRLKHLCIVIPVADGKRFEL